MIKELAEKNKDYVIKIRRELHMNPGLSWEELKLRIIKRELEKMGIPLKNVQEQEL